MSPSDANLSPNAKSAPRAAGRGALIAILVGILIGGVFVAISMEGSIFAGRSDLAIEIRINDLDEQTGRDVLIPISGWVLQIFAPEDLPEAVLETLSVTLREERTGTTLEIVDRLNRDGRLAWIVVPENLGLVPGLFSVRASLYDADGRELVTHRRIRIRTWLGGPPIGPRQAIHFDFLVDRDEDGRPDFETDLERFGLASPESKDLAAAVADQLASRALSRVLRAYDPSDDPDATRRVRDIVCVRFLLEAEWTPYTTRICVGGKNTAYPDSVGNVRYDPRNAIKGQPECEPRDEEPAAGLFPAELTVYRKSALYQEILAPFDPEQGGTPIGLAVGDENLLSGESARSKALLRAINIMGDVLGTVMAHESAHALGLVPAGRPGVGLFGGSEADGASYAHNINLAGNPESQPWLMNEGREFSFEDLAGLGEAGELRFRPLNHAYLKDRVVLINGRSTGS